MYGLLPFYHKMVSNIMLFLLITSQNTFGSTPSKKKKKKLKFRKFSKGTRPLWKIIFLKKLSLSTLIMEANIWSSKIISSSTTFPTSPLHHIPLNTMVTLKEDTAILLKLASPYSLMLHFQTPSGLMPLLLLFTSLTGF